MSFYEGCPTEGRSATVRRDEDTPSAFDEFVEEDRPIHESDEEEL